VQAARAVSDLNSDEVIRNLNQTNLVKGFLDIGHSVGLQLDNNYRNVQVQADELRQKIESSGYWGDLSDARGG
jgi:hypothetical protein